jgi:hypothetical protein
MLIEKYGFKQNIHNETYTLQCWNNISHIIMCKICKYESFRDLIVEQWSKFIKLDI